jgi:hypothetical protein
MPGGMIPHSEKLTCGSLLFTAASDAAAFCPLHLLTAFCYTLLLKECRYFALGGVDKRAHKQWTKKFCSG